jgi:hypothetical protein
VACDVGDVEAHQLRAAEATGEAQEEERPVAQPEQPRRVARRHEGAQLLGDGGRLALARRAVRAADAAPDVAQVALSGVEVEPRLPCTCWMAESRRCSVTTRSSPAWALR